MNRATAKATSAALRSIVTVGVRPAASIVSGTMAYCSVTDSPADFGSCLASFSLDELLVLKKSVERMGLTDCEEPSRAEQLPEAAESRELPERMALMAADRGDHSSHHGGPWHSDHTPYWPESKPSKLQTLFQISITALAFLSFGGYLLCLIVQAIKSKGTVYYHPVSTASTASTSGNVKRIKVYRRSKRSKANADHSEPSSIFAQDYASYMRAVRGQAISAHLVGS